MKFGLTVPKRFVLCLAFALAFALLVITPAPNLRAAGATMQVEAYFSGHFKFGEWLPLRISLTNDGPAFKAQVRADTTVGGGQTVYVAPVELATGARKRLTLYVQPPSFARSIRVRLMDGENEVDSRSVDLTVERNVNYLVGVASGRSQVFAQLNGLTLNPQQNEQAFKAPPQYSRTVKILPIPLADIPDRPEGLRTLDALVMTGVDTNELSLGQKAALAAFVQQGGRLILGGGAAAARTLAGMPDELAGDFRAVDRATDVMSLSGLGKFAGQDVRVPGPFTVAWPAATGRILIDHEGRGLLVEKSVGEGFVNYVALDLSASPFDAWGGMSGFWTKLLTPGSAYPAGAPPDVSPQMARAGSTSYALQNMPALELPSVGWLATLLGVYLVLVGPINYLVLRRLRRLAWGWLTIPAMTLLFSAGAFGFAYNLRGGDVIVHEISILTLNGESGAPAETYVGVFSPERTTYTLSFAGSTLVSPIAPEGNPFGPGGVDQSSAIELVEGEQTEVRGVQVNQWAMQGFRAESPVPAGWKIDSSLTVEGERIRGALVNMTSETIVDAVLVTGNRVIRLGDLPAGQSRTLEQTTSSTVTSSSFPYALYQDSSGSPPSREVQMRQQLLANYFQEFGGPPQPPREPTLIGWMHASPTDVQIPGARWVTQQTSLIVAPLRLQYAPGHIHLLPGEVTPQVVERDGSVGMCGPGNQIFINTGKAVLEYRLPDDLARLQVTRLGLLVQIGDAPNIEIQDRNGNWVKLDSPRTGHNELENPSRWITSDGVLRLRLSVSGNANPRSCAQYDLDVEGELAK